MSQSSLAAWAIVRARDICKIESAAYIETRRMLMARGCLGRPRKDASWHLLGMVMASTGRSGTRHATSCPHLAPDRPDPYPELFYGGELGEPAVSPSTMAKSRHNAGDFRVNSRLDSFPFSQPTVTLIMCSPGAR